MSVLWAFDIAKLQKEYNLEYFVETGLGEGKGLRHALKFPFKEYHSIELYKDMFDKGIKIFSGENIKLYLGTTRDLLPSVISTLTGNILFWLDAHLPDFLWGDRFSQLDKDLKLPLEDELKIIQQARPNSKDVLLCDDLRIYEDGPFESGNWNLRPKYENAIKGIDFIYDLFGKTHVIKRDFRHEGYIILLPRQ